MKIIPAQYIADDGTIFETQEDCQEYEVENKTKLAILNNQLQFYDGEGNPTSFSNASFMYIKSPQGYQVAHLLSKYYCMSIPLMAMDAKYPVKGYLFYYEPCNDEWIDFTAQVEAQIALHNKMMDF